MTKQQILILAELSKFEFSEQELNKLEKEMTEQLKNLSPEQIIKAAETASNSAKYDGVKFMPSFSGARNIDELYKKTRNNFFDWETKKQIMLGNFILSKGNYEKYFVEAKNKVGKTQTVKIADLREDIIKPSLNREEFLNKAPKSDGEYFVVPQVVE